MMETIKEKEDLYLYNNNIFEKVYFINGDMALRFQTIKVVGGKWNPLTIKNPHSITVQIYT